MEKERLKKICIYCDHWQNGGVEAYLMNLFRFWDFDKLEPELVVSQTETDLYDDELKTRGIRRIITLDRQHDSPIQRILHNLPVMHTLLKNGGYDVVYFNLSNSFTMIYAWMAKRAGIPVRVVHSHCSGIKPSATLPIKQLAHALGRWLFTPCVTHYFACSELAGRWMFGKEVERNGQIHLIHNAVDTAAFAENFAIRQQMRETLSFRDKWVVGTVGRFSEQKNPFFLLDCFQRLTELRRDARLLWVGEGELYAQVRNYAKRLGIEERILFYGKTNEVPKMLWAMDVFCLPSRFEGNPVSVIEAQAAGCICLVSNTVTQQCKVSANVQFLPIDQGVEIWAEAMRDAKRVCTPEDATEQVRRNGYDAKTMSVGVQKLLAEAL